MRFLLLILVFFVISTTHAQPIIYIKDGQKELDIRRDMLIYVENNSFHTHEQVSQFDSIQFQAVTKPIGGFFPSNFWLKFVVNNQSNQDAIIDFLPSISDSILLYCSKPDGTIEKLSTGQHFTFQERGLLNTNQNLKLVGNHNINQVYYIYITTKFPINYKIRIGTHSQMSEIYHYDSIISGLLFGIIITFILISFVMYFTLKKTPYFWYGLYLISLTFLMSFYYGQFQQFIFPNTPQYNIYARILTNFPSLLGLIFQMHFLKIKKYLPKYYKISTYLVVLFCCNIFIGLIGFLDLSIFISHIFSIPIGVYVIYLSLKLYNKKNIALLLLILGTVSLTGTLGIYIIDNLIITPTIINIKFVIHLGMIIQAFFLTLAMAQQVREIMNEKEKAKLQYINSLQETKELIHQQNIELEKRIQDRTQELQKALDREKEKEIQLVRSNKELTEFAHIVSHDLKAPLRNIASFSQIIARKTHDRLDEREKEYMNYVITGAKQGTQLVDDLLNYSKLDKNIGDPLPIDLNEMLCNIISNNVQILRDKNADIIAHYLPNIQAHKSLISLLWQNIILNGLKYNDNPNPYIEVGVFKEKENLVFWISDNGIGIPPQYQEEVFRMFRRLHTSDKYEGTGIGLAFCKRIVDFYEGKIWFESIEECGTTFFFTLPKISLKQVENIHTIKSSTPSVLVA
jgi:signal transduction histidine kinase